MKKKYIILIGVLAIMLVGTVSAAAITARNRRLEAMTGGRVDVTDSIIISHDSVENVVVAHVDVAERGTSSSDPVYFDKTLFINIAGTPLTAGNWFLHLSLNTTESTPANSIFEVKLRLVGAVPSQLVSIFTLYVATSSTVEADAMILCFFEIGPELNTPYTYKVTVEKIET